MFGNKKPQYDYALNVEFVNGSCGHVYCYRSEATAIMTELKLYMETRAVGSYHFDFYSNGEIGKSGTAGWQDMDQDVDLLVNFSDIVCVRRHPNFK